LRLINTLTYLLIYLLTFYLAQAINAVHKRHASAQLEPEIVPKLSYTTDGELNQLTSIQSDYFYTELH